MKIESIHRLEKAVILFLNTFDDWQLEHTGSDFDPYDAKGITPKGRKCVIEMKFRKTYYDTKMLEVAKYKRLMSLPDDVVKIYFVADPKGSYFFWLDGIDKLKSVKKFCPKTTLWGSKKQKKEVYLLSEDLASYITRASTD